MLEFSFGGDDLNIPQLDITKPDTPVQVEVDRTRGVLYVHIEGYTCLRICRCSTITVVEHK